MNRVQAKNIHEAVNASFWIENKRWDAGSKLANFTCEIVRKLPFSIYELEKKLLFKNPDLVTVSGESVVVDCGETVDKFMFRYPKNVTTEAFKDGVKKEVASMIFHLANIAISTDVSVKKADIFKNHFGTVASVTQTQPKLDLKKYPNFDLNNFDRQASSTSDKTVRDLEQLIVGSYKLFSADELYPDLSFSGGNLRVGVEEGDLKLIDVMPLHGDGTRLIGDHPSKLPHSLATLKEYENFIGSYGS